MPSIAYSRHSRSESSDDTRLLLEAETVAVMQYCERHGWEPPQWQYEQSEDWHHGFSARLTPHAENANFSAELADYWVPTEHCEIVIYSLQRMFNAAGDIDQTLSWMRERDITLHVVALNAEISQTRALTRTQVDFDYMLREMQMIEQRRGADRMKRVKLLQRDKGRFLGGSKPFGYMVHSNGKLIENPLEQKVLRQIYQLRDRGHSLRDIARQVSTPIAPVSFKTVQRILQRGDNPTIGKPNV